MITALHITVLASSALRPTHPAPNHHRFAVINISCRFVGRKTQRLDFTLRAKYLPALESGGVGCHGRRRPSRSDGGKLVVALEWAGSPTRRRSRRPDFPWRSDVSMPKTNKQTKLPPKVSDVCFSAVAMVTTNQPPGRCRDSAVNLLTQTQTSFTSKERASKV